MKRVKEFIVKVECPADQDITSKDILTCLTAIPYWVGVKEVPQITEEQLDGMGIYNASSEGYDENSEDENIFRIGYEVGFRDAERIIKTK